MNKKQYTGAVFSSLFLLATTAFADQVTATFNAGETLDSAKLGDLAAQINDNDNEITALQTQTGALSINPYSAFVGGSASFLTGVGPNAGVFLPESGQSDVSFGFMLPADYIFGDPINIELIWSTSGISCDIRLAPNFISVSRPGIPFIQGSGSSTGLSGVGGNILTATSTTNLPQSKLYALTPPDGVTAYKAKDAIVFGLFRRPSNPADTCVTDLKIHGVVVLY